jgi:hypothetical protein
MFCCPRCSHLSTILNNIVEPESGVTILFNIVDNCEQCGQQNIVQSCFHQYCINLSVFTRVRSLDYSYNFELSVPVYVVGSPDHGRTGRGGGGAPPPPPPPPPPRGYATACKDILVTHTEQTIIFVVKLSLDFC